jgi:uncharacterized lipoprotein YmbA
LTELAVWLEASAPETSGVSEFNMMVFIERPRAHDCGTACCIAGAAIQFAQDKPFSYDEWLETPANPFQWASTLLDIDYLQASLLFHCEDEYGEVVASQREIDSQWAARCIRKLIDTGGVDWLGTRHV